MSIEEFEAEALKLAPEGRARLAAKLLESLEVLSDSENLRLWAEEAQRWDDGTEVSADQPAAEVFHDIKARLR